MSKLSIPRKLTLSLAILSILVILPLAYTQSPLSITVSTNKRQYFNNETVTVSGRILDSQSNPVAGASVSVQVGDPPIHATLLFSDSSGQYSDSFILAANVLPGQYMVYATVTKAGYSSAQQQTQFTILQQTTTTTSTTTKPTSPPSKCFIATATYGSEVSPEVALLRNFRDAQVIQTSAGRGFMQAFNAFYYSFSPQVARVISSHETLRTGIKIVLYPLIGILYVSSVIFRILSFNEELAVTISGIFAAFSLGAVYFGPLTVLGRRFIGNGTKSTLSKLRRLVPASCTLSILAIIFGEAGRMAVVLGAAGVAAVLSFLLLGPWSILAVVTLSVRRKSRSGITPQMTSA